MSSNAIVKRNVKRIRTAKKISQAELARRARVSLRYLIDIENKEHNLSLETVDALAQGLGVPPFVLLMSRDASLPEGDGIQPVVGVEDILKGIDDLRELVEACNGMDTRSVLPSGTVASLTPVSAEEPVDA